MAHEIDEKIDLVYSTEGSEWHGLAKEREVIGAEEKASVSFPIVAVDASVSIGGISASLVDYGWKVMVGDFTHREDIPEKDRVRPLYVPRTSYTPIPNALILEKLDKALDGIPHTLTTLGTLCGGKRFFATFALTGHEEIIVNGSKIKAHLCAITSHDGTLAWEVYDAMTRIVCNNTLEWSRSEAEAIAFKVFHTASADVRGESLAGVVNAILSGRDTFSHEMARLAKMACSSELAQAIVAGYFWQVAVAEAKKKNEKEPSKLSTRTRNAIDEISRLAWHGQGNSGGDLWNLLNGATEYWSGGDGSGKAGKNKGKKVYSAQFGRAMDHKRAFIDYILTQDVMTAGSADGRRLLSLPVK